MGTNVTNINKSPLAAFAGQYDLDPLQMERTLKETVFKLPKKYGDSSPAVEVTNEQMVMLMVVAKEHNLNPFKKEIYAFPSQGGIVAMVPIDGWLNIINSHPEYDGMEFNESDPNEWEERAGSQPCPKWIECVIYRKDRSRPTKIKEYFDETYRNTAPWNQSTKRMLRHKAIIQCARVAFSLGGIFDEDEAPEIALSETKIVNEVPDSGVETTKPADKPKSQSRTEELMAKHGVVERNPESAETPEKTEEAQPKKLTTQKKTALLKKIEESETPDALHELAGEFAQFEKTDPLLIPIRTAWKDKMASLQK